MAVSCCVVCGYCRLCVLTLLLLMSPIPFPPLGRFVLPLCVACVCATSTCLQVLLVRPYGLALVTSVSE